MEPPPPPPPTPYDYQVQWIGFSGTQHLKLPEMRLADLSALSYRISTERTSEMCLVGNHDGDRRVEFYISGHKVAFWNPLDGSRSVDSKCPPEVTTARYDIMPDRFKISVASESVTHSSEFAAIDERVLQTRHVLLVGAYSTSQEYAFVGNLYSLKIYRGGILAINLIPVVLENEGCFYDTVNEIFYKNEGTGNLIIGPRL